MTQNIHAVDAADLQAPGDAAKPLRPLRIVLNRFEPDVVRALLDANRDVIARRGYEILAPWDLDRILEEQRGTIPSQPAAGDNAKPLREHD